MTDAKGERLWQIPWVRDAASLGVLAAGIVVAYTLRSIVMPILLALILAYLTDPVLDWTYRRLRVPRWATASMLLLTLAAAGAGFLAWFGPQLAEQVRQLSDRLPEYADRISRALGLSGDVESQVDRVLGDLRDNPLSFLRMALTGTWGAVGFLGGVFGVTAHVALTVVLVPIYFVLFAWKLRDGYRYALRFLPESRRVRTLDILRRMDRAVSGYFLGRLAVALVMAFFFAVGWSPLLADVPYWFLLALLTGLVSVIPYAAGAGWLLALLLKYLDMIAGPSTPGAWDYLIGLGGPTLVYGVVQFCEGWFLTPWIQSRSTDLGAGTVLFVVLVGGALGGVYGLILAIPVTACLKIAALEVVVPRLEAWASDA